MFDTHVPASLAAIPGRRHVCYDDPDEQLYPCRLCGQMKAETAFPLRKTGSRRKECKACMSARSTEWNKANRARINARRKA